ncbi:MAG: phage tail protein [Rhodoplanes sp.]|uniref:phage tail protein n=1 Tax=Rhodoplanes sp. TaxID=1968906 RepID=UPI0018239FFD|nr:tail fiber protein [Rhodoplanes sp.]NVO13399.1 phage tail protein [Rhodoplanes sp.]
MPLEPFIGQIMPAGFGLVPRGWALCDGSLLAIQTNQALFALLGTTYGGDGIRTFALPDLRGRAVLGSDLASVPWGQVSGTETASVSVAQLPSHNHTIQASTTAGTGRGASPAGNLFAKNTASPVAIFAPPASGDVALASGTNVGPAGGSTPHNNMQPYLAVNYLIALNGVFPPRP